MVALLPRTGELHGIGEQVGERDLDQRRIGVDGRQLLHLPVYHPPVQLDRKLADHVFHQRSKLDLSAEQVLPADAGEIDQVVHQSRHLVGRLMDPLGVVPGRRVQLRS